MPLLLLCDQLLNAGGRLGIGHIDATADSDVELPVPVRGMAQDAANLLPRRKDVIGPLDSHIQTAALHIWSSRVTQYVSAVLHACMCKLHGRSGPGC